MTRPDPMETMQDAIARLEARGFRESFRASAEGFVALGSKRVHAPEDLAVAETVRFEGESNPADEAVLFAIEAKDGSVRGTFVTSFGPSADPTAAELMRRLDEKPPLTD